MCAGLLVRLLCLGLHPHQRGGGGAELRWCVHCLWEEVFSTGARVQKPTETHNNTQTHTGVRLDSICPSSTSSPYPHPLHPLSPLTPISTVFIIVSELISLRFTAFYYISDWRQNPPSTYHNLVGKIDVTSIVTTHGRKGDQSEWIREVPCDTYHGRKSKQKKRLAKMH